MTEPKSAHVYKINGHNLITAKISDEPPHRKQDIGITNSWYKRTTKSNIHLDLQNFSNQTSKPGLLLANIEAL